MDLRVARIVESTEAEGPGARFAIWTQGCPIRCPGCCNPEMFGRDGGALHSVAQLLPRIRAAAVEGVTFLGGEPFAQAAACAELARRTRASGLSVVVFSGYTFDELERSADPSVASLLDSTDLLFAGPYIREQPETERRWIGSSNQTVHFLSDRYAETDPGLRQSNTIEIRFRRGEMTVNGWPRQADDARPELMPWKRR